MAFADESSAFDGVVEALAEQSREALQRVQEADGNTSAVFDAQVFSSASQGIMLHSVESGFPVAFDLRDGKTNGFGESLVTSVKGQSPWTSCWGFGAMAAAEASIIADSSYFTADNLDLSERHVSWFAATALADDDEYYPAQAGEGTHWLDVEGVTNIDDSVGSMRLNGGGNQTLATSVLACGTGPLLEEYAPYQGKEGLKHHSTDEVWVYSPDDDWSLDADDRYAYSFELSGTNILPAVMKGNAEGMNALKSELQRGRAASAMYMADASAPGQEADISFINPETYAHYTWRDSAPNHSVCIVGWDDAYSKYFFEPNFTTDDGELNKEFFMLNEDGSIMRDADTGELVLNEKGIEAATQSSRIPEQDGAWIVKNSWGAGGNESPNWANWGVDEDGDGLGDGYFYLSYYDKSLQAVETCDFNIEASEAETEGIIIDQHDLMPALAYMTASNFAVDGDEILAANVFTATENQMLREVGVMTAMPNTEVEVQVYLLGESYEETKNPTDGVLVKTATGKFAYGGYHRVVLRDFGVSDEGLKVSEGKKYSVVVKQQALLQVNSESGVVEAEGTYIFANAGLSINAPVVGFATGGLKSYSESVVNEGESYLGVLKSASSSHVWEDWAVTTQNTEAAGGNIMEFDNLSIKVYADPVLATDVVITEGVQVEGDLAETAFDTPEKIMAELERVLVSQEGFENGTIAFYDAKLQVLGFDGEWREPTVDELLGSVSVTLPYPEGTNADDYDFCVAHMFGYDNPRLGIEAGDIELPVVTPTAEGLQFTLKSFSPVAVSWVTTDAEGADADAGNGDAGEDAGVLAPTGDSTTAFALLLASIVAASLTTLLIVRKRKA